MIIMGLLIVAPVVVPMFAHAQFIKPDCPPGVRCENYSLSGLIKTIINYMLAFSGLIALGFLIWGGFQYITAGGNEESAEKGKGTVFNAIIGLVIIGLSYVIVNVAMNFIQSSSPTA